MRSSYLKPFLVCLIVLLCNTSRADDNPQGPGQVGAPKKVACNNSPLLCDRRYDNITYLGAHDSPYSRNRSTSYSISGDQYYNSVIQLDAGVRLLTAQVHRFWRLQGVQWRLCHTHCLLMDAGLLHNWLASIKRWLDRNPNDVVTLVLVNSYDASVDDLHPEFVKSGIIEYAYIPSEATRPQRRWPKLKRMISMGKRVVIFLESIEDETNKVAPYILDQWTFTFENNFDVTNPRNFECTAYRPDKLRYKTKKALKSGRLPWMNHVLYHQITNHISVPAESRLVNTNAPSGRVGNLGDSADECTKLYGRPPTYILVDFFNTGPAIETIDRLNGVTGHISGRLDLPPGPPPKHN